MHGEVSFESQSGVQTMSWPLFENHLFFPTPRQKKVQELTDLLATLNTLIFSVKKSLTLTPFEAAKTQKSGRF